MESSLFINTLHVCFESVLAMDNAGMVAMFESLVDTGLKGFLGCPAVIHKAALLELFANGSVRDGLVVSTVNGVTVEFSEQLFAETFELPVEGLTDLSEIPKDLVFDARSIVSLSGEPMSMSGKNKDMVIEFRILCDILAKTISVKAGSFDEITQEKFLMMAAITCGVRINWNRLLFNIFKDMVTPGSRQAKGYAIQISLLLENVPNLELGESSEFPSSKVLTEKTMHRYIVLNDKVGMEVVKAEPRVKKTPVKRAASKKRPATDAAVAPVVKKKRTTKSITDSACKNQLVVVSIQYGPFNPYIPIRSTTIGKSRIAKDPIAMHTSWRSNSDIASVTSIGYPRMSASGESWTTMHRLLHASRSHPIPPPNDPKTLAVVEPVFVFVSRQSPVISWRLSQLCTAFIRYSLFSSLSTADIRSFVSTIAFERTVFRDVQIVQSSVSAIPSVHISFASADRSYVQLLLYQRPQSPSTTTDSSMHFVEDDIQLEDDSALDHFISTSSATVVTTSIDALPESFSNFVSTQSKDSRQTNNDLVEVMNTIDHVKRVFLDSIAEHNETFRGLFKHSRQEAQNDNNALSLALKAVRNQNVILSTDLEATRKEVRDIQAALSKDFDDKLADIRNELLEFRVETQGQLASLGTHLAELIAFLTKGDKKGEGSSGRPQPPPDNQSRPSGGNGGSGNRAEKQSRYRGGSRSRGDRSASSKRRYSSSGGGPFRSRGGSRSRGDRSASSKRRYSSSGGGPFRRSFEDWHDNLLLISCCTNPVGCRYTVISFWYRVLISVVKNNSVVDLG
ncbi:hypothetical protein F511_27965 [Dorcoceras hygrometricum]|uniref:Dystroglycan-like n=1 Tax=Dorcoceras hygrometricum TaxID=472368 RepID=A0A2Z7CVD3_9LAMI|nr:hypothetical protein F511_27965 [Dorcoceras hygrometricum]